MRRVLPFIMMLTLLAGSTAIGQAHAGGMEIEQDSIYRHIELSDNNVIIEDEIYETVDEMPQFPGGLEGLMEFLNTHITYPPIAAERNIEGSVIVRFIVEKDGSISGVRILRSVDINLDYEAIRVCKSLPKFIPGRKNGEVVRVWFALPVKFKLT